MARADADGGRGPYVEASHRPSSYGTWSHPRENAAWHLPRRIRRLVYAVGQLAPHLTIDQARAALGRVLDTVPDTTNLNFYVLEATAEAIEQLASKLATDRQQAEATLGRILTAIQSTRAPNGLWPLLRGLQRLAPHLTTDQAQAALDSVLEHWRNTRPMSLGDIKNIAQTVNLLPIRPSAQQMQLALGRILDTLPEWPTGDPSSMEVGAGAIEVLAANLTTDQAESALRAILRAMFSWSSGGWLGVEYEDMSDEMASRLEAREPSGVRITQVDPGSPAESATIQANDVIIALDGRRIDHAISLTRLLASEHPGKKVVVRLWRRGETKDLTVTLGESIIWLDDIKHGRWLNALVAMVKALKALPVKALPVQLTPEQAQMVSRSIRKLKSYYTNKTYAPGAMAEVVEALAPKLTDQAKVDFLSAVRSVLIEDNGHADVRWVRAYEALLPPSSAEDYDKGKADMLSVVRSVLSVVGSGDADVRWVRAYEALLPPSSAEDYIGSVVEVLKYPTSAIKKRRPSEEELKRNPEEYETLTATEYFQEKMSESLSEKGLSRWNRL